MSRAFIGIGSNINPKENIKRSLDLLSDKVRIINISTVYKTPPAGCSNGSFFLNCVVEIETDLLPEELKYSLLRKIEEQLGRSRSGDKNAPRTIDLDLLIYDDLVIDSDDIVLPDPHITERAFLAVSLYELSPDLIIPGTGESISSVVYWFKINDMEPLPEFTEQLRGEK